MALLERVRTLIRANLNDLVDRAEDPEKMIKQVILDMRNQLLQVKTQVAIAIADQHLLEKKRKENEDSAEDWVRKAELAVDKQQDDLARVALDRSISARTSAESFGQQVADQKQQVEELKSALHQLERKLSEAQAKADLMVAQSRRSRVVTRAVDARVALSNGDGPSTFDRMRDRVDREEAISKAKAELFGQDIEDRFAQLEKHDQIEKLLSEIKQKKGLPAPTNQLASD